MAKEQLPHELIDNFCRHKKELDALNKVVESEKSQIKSIMIESNLNEETTNNYTVTLTKSERTSMDTDKLLNVVKEFDKDNSTGLVKTIEVVDMEVLETLLYNNSLPRDIISKMNNCKKVTEVITLRNKEIK